MCVMFLGASCCILILDFNEELISVAFTDAALKIPLYDLIVFH